MNETREQLFGLLSPVQKAAFAAVREAMVSDPKALDNHSRDVRPQAQQENSNAAA